MKRPKHERLTELLTDAFWSGDNSNHSITDPQRMTPVVHTIMRLMKSQTPFEDDEGSLEWAAWWLEKRLQEDAEQ